MSIVCPACGAVIEQGLAQCPRCAAALETPSDASSDKNAPERKTTRIDRTIEFVPQPPPADEQPPEQPPASGGHPTVIGHTVEFDPSATPASFTPPFDPRRTPADYPTIQFGAERPEKPAPVGRTVTGIEATVAGSPGDSRLLATVDSAQLSESEARHLAKLWNEAAGGTDTGGDPRMTIRGRDSRPVGTRSSLVIRSRTVQKGLEAPTVNADYELLEVLGEGGMGVVYLARQASIDRTVAVKMLKAEFASDREQMQKFLSEAVVTGDLEHPNIVPMYDLGTNDEGALFYAMKRVQGTPWSKVIDKKSLTENLDILMKVADAVAFAHARGIVHRDLKPENVMLGDFGEVLVMDWGLAYSTPNFRKAGSIVQSGSMGGTPAYMAPEMALGPVERVSPASDVYLLGAILYEINTGHPPHTGSNITQCLWAAARNDIRPTDKEGELMDIAYRALSTKPEDRYPTVLEFQAAIREYRSHSESIVLAAKADEDLQEARRTGDYRIFSRALFGYEEALAMWSGNQRARQGVSIARLEYARTAHEKHDYDLAASLLVADDPEHVELAERVRRAQTERDARHQRLRNVRRTVVGLAAAIVLILIGSYFQIRSERDRARNAEIAATAERDNARAAENRARAAEADALAAADQARAAQMEAVESARLAREAEMEARQQRDAAHAARQAEEYEAYVAQIGLSAARIDENAFGTATELLDDCPPRLRGWEWYRLQYLNRLSDLKLSAQAPVTSVVFEPDGQAYRLATLDGKVLRFDAKGQQTAELHETHANVYSVAISADGRWLATGSGDPQSPLKLWDAATGKLIRTFNGHTDAVHRVRFVRQDQWLLSASRDNTARLWNVETGELLATLDSHSWWVWDAALSPDGSRAVTVSQDGTAIVWNIDDMLRKQPEQRESRPALRLFTGHEGPVLSVDIAPDGRTVATGGYDKRIILWNADDVPEFNFQRAVDGEAPPKIPSRTLTGHEAAVQSLAFSSDGRQLLSGSHDNTLRLWDVDRAEALKTLRGHASQVTSCQFSSDGHRVLSGSHDRTARTWNLEQYEEQRVLAQRVLEGHDDAVLSADFAPKDQWVVTSSRDRSAILWDAQTGEPVRRFEEGHAFLASTAIFTPDAQRLVTSAVDNTTRIWDVAAGTQQLELSGTGRSAAVAISADGRWILTGSDRQMAILWEGHSGEMLAELPAHSGEITAVAISPDGKWLAAGEVNGRFQVWDAKTRERRHAANYHSRRITALAFAPDGKRLLVASLDNTVSTFDLDAGREMKERILKHPDAVLSLALSRDGRQALTACQDGAVRVWDTERAALLGTPFDPDTQANFASWSGDGRWVLAVSSQRRQLRLRDMATGREVGPKSDDGSGPLLGIKQLGNLVWSAALAPDGNRIVTIGGTSARLWDMTSARVVQTFSPHGAVAAASFSPDGKLMITGSWDGSAKIWEVASGRAQIRLEGQHARFVNAACFTPDGRYALTAADDGLAVLWFVASGEPVRTFKGHEGPIRDAVFSPDGKWLATASLDRTARIWNVETGQTVHTLKGHSWHVLACAFSDDSRRLATGSGDNSAIIWDVATGRALVQVPGHTAAVTTVAFAPGGHRLLTGSQDSLAKLWDAHTGKELLTLRGHTEEVTSVRFSHDGNTVLTASRDGTAILWLAETPPPNSAIVAQ